MLSTRIQSEPNTAEPLVFENDDELIESARSEWTSIEHGVGTLIKNSDLSGVDKDQIAQILHDAAARLEVLARNFDTLVYYVSQPKGRYIIVVYWASTVQTKPIEEWICQHETMLRETKVQAGCAVAISMLIEMVDRGDFRSKHDVDWYRGTDLVRIRSVETNPEAVADRSVKGDTDILSLFRSVTSRKLKLTVGITPVEELAKHS